MSGAHHRPTRQLRTVYRTLLSHHGPQDWWPGDSPFEIMVGAVLTQNTAWSNVERAIANLKENDALSPGAILAAHHRRLAGWLKPSGYFNVKAKRLRSYCKWYLEQGEFASLQALATDVLREGLLSVNGVGPETADDILLYAFQRPVFVIDAYTRRFLSRMNLLDGSAPYESLRGIMEESLLADAALYNEYHALIVRHGKEICRVKPRCGVCVMRRKCPAAI